ncbi:MAG: Crp/Fnr family transcriptional regulator [Firmicutes bacterium]|nr:Crp/Fnr family transcriptional regulator [Bacillota bacterium]
MDCSAIPLLQALPAEAADRDCQLRYYCKGDVIFAQGEPATGLWVIVKGQVTLKRLTGKRTYPYGIWRQGDPIALLTLFDGRPYPASAWARTTPTVCCWMARDVALHHFLSNPDFALALNHLMAVRLQLLLEILGDTGGRPLALQLAILLLALHQRYGNPVPFGRKDLAHMLGARPETVGRLLETLEQAGCISKRHGSTLIRDAACLAQRLQSFPST